MRDFFKSSIAAVWVCLIFQTAARAEAPAGFETRSLSQFLKVAVVGDTGIGKRAFAPGFRAVQQAMARQGADVLLHLGDFVYQPKRFPAVCNPDHIREIRRTLVEPYRFRLFVPGDNDLPPQVWKPMASGCWKFIDPLDTPFDLPAQPGPGSFEGTKVIGNVLFAVLNTYPWRDPTTWLGPRIERARRDGLWIVLALHEPPVTTAWFKDKRGTVLKQIDALRPDLVFAGNQHSYERFKPMGFRRGKEGLSVMQTNAAKYIRGRGVIYIVSGGGGATFKPFADMQGVEKRTAPEEVFVALAVRALVNHFMILEFEPERMRGRTYRVCPAKTPEENPRWKPQKEFWKTISLPCDELPEGVTVFDEFEIHKNRGN
ncbi:MAG: metallophosphoesterase family protein [Nitrospinales bacterium]